MLSIGLVTFPVQAFNAVQPGSHFDLHQLHKSCHSRIHYVKTCPIHGPVSNDEIVSAYEYRPGEYVEIDDEELDSLYSDRQRALSIEAFIAPEQLDPIHFDGRMYYLVPADAESLEPYLLFREAMEKQERWGVGRILMSGRRQLAMIRVYEQGISMALLHYADELRSLETVLHLSGRTKAAAKKSHLAETLVKEWTQRKFDISAYADESHDELAEMIEAKVKGRKVVAPEEEEEPETVDLMDALRRSIARQAKSADGRHHRAKSRSAAKSPRRTKRTA